MGQYALRALQAKEVTLGRSIPWDVVDRWGQLLLAKGAHIDKEDLVSHLLEHGYRQVPKSELARMGELEMGQHERRYRGLPMQAVRRVATRLGKVYASAQKLGLDVDEIRDLVHQLVDLTRNDPDEALASVVLCNQGSYAIWHAVHVAIVGLVLAGDSPAMEEARKSVAAATLTMNYGMYPLQDELQNQEAPLTDEQRETVRSHPAASAEALREAGVTDPIWLEAVAMHHERLDGSGYPRGLSGREIPFHARLLSACDVYCAAISSRSYRRALTPGQAMREIFVNSGKLLDEALAQRFVKVLGIYLPGTVVRLANNEVAMVVARSEQANAPMVASFVSRWGEGRAPALRATVEEEFAITEIVDPDDVRGYSNLLHLWGDVCGVRESKR